MVWFWRFRSGPFVGDDLPLITGYTDPYRSLGELLTADHVSNRWRPFADLAFTATAALFGESFTAWWALNILILAASASLLGALLWRYTRSYAIGFLAASLLITSRFVLYQVATATGQIEALSTLFATSFIASGLMFMTGGRKAYLWVMWASFTLAFMTHERYQALLVPAFLLLLLTQFLPLRRKLGWGALFVAPVLLLALVKTQVFGLPLAVGTGTAQGVGFSWFSTWQHLFESLSQLLGLNFGPSYLVGREFSGAFVFQAISSVALVGLTAILVVGPSAIGLALDERNPALSTAARGAAFIATTGGAVLGASIVTSNLQQRWLVVPYVCLLVFIGCGIGYLRTLARGRRVDLVIGSVAGLFVAVSLFMNWKYREGYDSLFFRVSQSTAVKNMAVMKDANRSALRGGRKVIYFVEPSRNKPVLDGLISLFRGNSSEPTVPFVLVTRPATALRRDPRAIIVWITPDGSVSRFK